VTVRMRPYPRVREVESIERIWPLSVLFIAAWLLGR
jgi:hypothetical protein